MYSLWDRIEEAWRTLPSEQEIDPIISAVHKLDTAYDRVAPDQKTETLTKQIGQLKKDIDIFSHAYSCGRFFRKYRSALTLLSTLTKDTQGTEMHEPLQHVNKVLEQERAGIINDFLFRRYRAGDMQLIPLRILCYRREMPRESILLMEDMVACKDRCYDLRRHQEKKAEMEFYQTVATTVVLNELLSDEDS